MRRRWTRPGRVTPDFVWSRAATDLLPPRAARARVLFALLAALLAGCDGQARTLVVSGVELWDGTGEPPVPDAALVVVDGRVACAGARAACPPPARAEVLEAPGFWVIPGLLDLDAGGDPSEREEPRVLRFLLGVTTTGGSDVGSGAADRDADRDAEARRPVPRRVGGSAPGRRRFTLDTVARRVLPAAGLADTADLSPRDRSVRRRTAWLDADTTALDRLAVELAASGAVLESRLVAEEVWAAPYRLPLGLHPLLELPLVTLGIQDRALPDRTDAEASLLAAAVERQRRFVRRFAAAGGTVVAATGGVLAPGLVLHAELHALVRAGLSPAEALGAATRDAALALGVADSLGTLEPGKLADFLILEGDPTEDILNSTLLRRVAKAGRLYDSGSLFQALLDSPGERATAPTLRLIVGLLAMLATAFVAWRVVTLHRRNTPAGWRQR